MMKKTHILLLISLGFIALCFLTSGCRTGGKWVKTSSSGIKSVVGPSDLVKQPSGTYKIKPINVKAPESKPVPIKPIYKGPETEILKESVAPKVKPAKIKSQPEKLPKISTSNLTAGNDEHIKSLSKRAENDPRFTPTEPQSASIDQNGKDSSVKVNWLELMMFYFLVGMGLIFIWILYDIRREYKKAKIQDRIDKGLSKPAFAKKARKRAPRKTNKRPKKKAS